MSFVVRVAAVNVMLLDARLEPCGITVDTRATIKYQSKIAVKEYDVLIQSLGIVLSPLMNI